MQASSAVRADQPVRPDPLTARGAELVLLDLGEERLLGERALIDLGQRLAWPDDEVQDHREDEEQRGEEDDQRCREVGKDRVLGARLHVAERPVGSPQPEQHDVDDDQLPHQLHDGVVDEVAPDFPWIREPLWHALRPFCEFSRLRRSPAGRSC